MAFESLPASYLAMIECLTKCCAGFAILKRVLKAAVKPHVWMMFGRQLRKISTVIFFETLKFGSVVKFWTLMVVFMKYNSKKKITPTIYTIKITILAGVHLQAKGPSPQIRP